MKTIAIIPARGGSKGIPKKNIKKLLGKPLIKYTIDAALKAKTLNEIIVSTEDEQISSVVNSNGIEVIRRPVELAQDDSLVIDTIRHVLKEMENMGKYYDVVVLLEPTSPLRTHEDIDNAVNSFIKRSADTLATFSELDVPPTRIWEINDNYPEPLFKDADPFLPRQKHKKGYFLNGMVYVLKVDALRAHENVDSLLFGNISSVIVPRERVIDIDEEIDFLIAEKILKHKKLLL